MERICIMSSPLELFKKLSEDDLFLQWKEKHPQAFLSHFFTPLSPELNFKSVWEIGFYDKEKITVFLPLDSGFEIKPADDIFKKKEAQVEELDLKKVKITLKQATDIFKESLPKYFPQEDIGEGFVILQSFKGMFCGTLLL